MSKKFIFSLFSFLLLATVCFAGNQFVLVIDAGHGGKDFGAHGAISYEKDLTLKFALAFGNKVKRNCPDVKVVYTRTTDVFVPLDQRAEIANKNKADLFISVHINALDGGKVARGCQTYALGPGQKSGMKGVLKNLEVAKRENSVILLEKDYKRKYQGFDPSSPESNIIFEVMQDKNMVQSVELSKMMQRNICKSTGRQDLGVHQNNFAVLRLSSMPGCLLELGFISTSDEESFMNSAQASNLYAEGIFNAFLEYKNKYASHIVVPYKPSPISEPSVPSVTGNAPVPEPKTEPKTVQEKAGKVVSHEESQAKEVTVAQPTTENKKTVAAKKTGDTAPVFKIQILISHRELRANDAHFKGLKNCEWYPEGDWKKYTVGSSADYNEIRRLLKQVADKFPDAFIIAFKNGEKMNVNQAIKEFRQNRQK